MCLKCLARAGYSSRVAGATVVCCKWTPTCRLLACCTNIAHGCTAQHLPMLCCSNLRCSVQQAPLCTLIIIIIIILPIQAIASAPSAPRPTGAERGGSTAPECLHALRTSQDLTRKAAIHGDTIRHLPELPQISSATKRNTLIDESAMDKTLRNFSAQPGRDLISANISSL
ncbi:hypothetical protein COO60DRAFT_1098051 [Scenedesmus sp. NREL 46B-D3]|nr:hypothetical protein COO60DRAFT_1098051 [Scenedesmus sp. NREL 46B-D3]